MGNKISNKEESKKISQNSKVINFRIKDLPIWAILPVFILTTVIFFWSSLSGTTFFWEDFVRFVYPVQSYAAKTYSQGLIPFWNPYSFGGMPFLADLQTGFFYPFNRMLSWFLDAKGNLPIGALQFVIILHYFISQVNFYFLGRKLKISSWGSMIGAISYSFSLMMICHAIHPMIVEHLAWLPLVAMFLIKAVDESKLKYGLWGGLIYGMSMLSGHPQFTLYEALLLGFIFIWRIILKFKNNSSKADQTNGNNTEKPANNLIKPVISIISAILIFGIGAGIFCIQYFPANELAKLSQRNEMTYQKASEGSLQFRQVFTSVAPKAYGYRDGGAKEDVPFYLPGAQAHYYWETAFYFGIVALTLGFFALIAGFKDSSVKFLGIISIFGFLFALGSNGFLFDIFFGLPLFSNFRNPARMMFMVIFAFSLLSGIGFDLLWKHLKDKGTSLKLVIGTAVPLFLAVLIASNSISATPAEYATQVASYGSNALIITIITFAIAFSINKKFMPAYIGGALLVILAFIDLSIAGVSFNQSDTNPEDMYKGVFKENPQLQSMLTPNPPQNLFRVNMRLYDANGRTIAKPMEDNQGMLDRIMLVEGYNPLILQRVNPPIKDISKIVDLKNVKYQMGIDSVHKALTFLDKKDYYPRAWLVSKANVINADNVESSMKSNDYNYRREVVIEENPDLPLSNSLDSLPDPVCKEYGINQMTFESNAPENSIMVFSEIWYPAWKVYIDDKQAKMLRADYCFRAVSIPSGKHDVRLVYESETYASGKTITITVLILSVLGLISTYVFGFYSKKKQVK